MAITSAIMQMRRGLEADFDPDKMQPGEWAVSTDEKYVRMCFSPGVCVRMATYDAFEADMAKIETILAECQTIEEAVTRINTEISEKANAVAEYTEQAKGYRDETKQFRDGAETSATNAKSSEDKAKVSETNAKVSEINAKISEENAQRVAESLPEDYTDLSKAFYNTAIKQKAVGDNIHVTDSAEARNVDFGLYGKAEQNGEPSPDNPIEITVSGSDGSVEVVSCGKNLLKTTLETKSVGGITCTNNGDGTYTLNGTASTSGASFALVNNDKQNNNVYNTSPKGKYLCGSRKVSNDLIYQLTVYGMNDSVLAMLKSNTDAECVKLAETENIKYVYLWIPKDTVLNNVVIKPMITTDANATYDTFEPYTETVSTIPTPNGLCGIKVSSGGNYTDENGQQWICDEIVKYADGSGKRIQRIEKAVFDGSDDEGWYIDSRGRWITLSLSEEGVNIEDINKSANALCTSYQIKTSAQTYEQIMGVSVSNKTVIVYDSNHSGSDKASWTAYLAENPMTLYYELAEPIITDLSAEEIAEIEKLHTFYPVTNISNDAECGMSVTYLCDAKNYIDNRLALIETALVNSI